MSISIAVKKKVGSGPGGRPKRTPEGLAKHVHAETRADNGDAALTMASTFKDRNLLAVIGDEVQLILNHKYLPPYLLMLGFDNWSPACRYWTYQ